MIQLTSHEQTTSAVSRPLQVHSAVLFSQTMPSSNGYRRISPLVVVYINHSMTDSYLPSHMALPVHLGQYPLLILLC